MLKINKKEQSLWNLCSKIEKRTTPPKQEVWMRLEQQIDISSRPKKSSAIIVSNKIKSLYPRISIALFMIMLITIPTIRMMNTVNIQSGPGLNGKIVILNDGTKVHLNAMSSISYSKNYNSKNREISLNGEAYFDVKKGFYPFIVSTEYANVVVLGTKFNVRSRKDGFETGVNEGLVRIENGTKSMTLNRGNQIEINPKKPALILQSEITKLYPGWKNNKIICDNYSLERICKELERIYAIKIEFLESDQKETLISGTLHLEPGNLESVLSSISLLSKREFKLQGDSYILL
jgi:ferric-dicitrate binding protein FerR (iron transport regulator)